MLTHSDEQRVRQIINDEVPDIVKKELDRIEVKIDRVLKIVTDDHKEQTVIKARINAHHKRLVKVEQKLKIKSPPEFAIA